MQVGAVIVAAGRGERVGAAAPKQLLDLGGLTMLQRSVAAFDAHPDVRQIVVVLPEELLADAGRLAGPTVRPCVCVAGGPRRQDSVSRGVAAISSEIDIVLIHDAARPFVSAHLIDRVVAAAAESGAAIPALPVRDTVKRTASGSNVIVDTIPREDVRLAQTPQGFRRDVLTGAMRSAEATDVTDDAMLLERAGIPVRVVEGDLANVKITTPQDLVDARQRLSAGEGAPMRVGTGYDLHRLADGRSLVLAGVVLDARRGPLGHSDGDVVCHALVDAIFGAAGEGDIGRHFPNTDPAWKDVPGLDLLARGLELVRGGGWAVVNADVTVVLERPRLAPAVQEIRGRLAAVLGVEIGAVSVKGKTNEGVDAVGHGDAIAAHAVVLLVRGTQARR